MFKISIIVHQIDILLEKYIWKWGFWIWEGLLKETTLEELKRYMVSSYALLNSSLRVIIVLVWWETDSRDQHAAIKLNVVFYTRVSLYILLIHSFVHGNNISLFVFNYHKLCSITLNQRDNADFVQRMRCFTFWKQEIN